jgi:hypothetical protein
MRYILFLSVLLYSNTYSQMPGEYTESSDTVYRFVDYKNNHYKIMYEVDETHWADMLVIYYDKLNHNHYDAMVSVMKQLKDSTYKLVFKKQGTYVPAGCYEDIPLNYVKWSLGEKAEE